MQQTQSRVSQANSKIEKIISIEDLGMELNVKSRIQQRLQQDAQVLLEKKKKDEEKRERIKRVEDHLERERIRKLKAIAQKQHKSEEVMQKNKELFDQKVKRKQQYFNEIIKKQEQKELQNIETALSKQKLLENSSEKLPERKYTNSSVMENTLSPGRSRYIYPDNIKQISEQIQFKSKRAKDNHQKFNKLVVQRLRQKSESVNHTYQKAKGIQAQDQIQQMKSWKKKAESIQTIQQSVKGDREKRLLQRRRSFRTKIDKCSQNLRHLTEKQQQKSQILQSKFDRKLNQKEWRDSRLEKYWRLWESNIKKVEQKMNDQASKILQKHKMITQQNRVYKQKKQKLLQVIKLV